jgi:glycine oxidase
MGLQKKSDVLIIGGGVIGLSLARELHKKGVRNIAIVDRGQCGMEASYAAAGMLAPHAETDRIDPFFRLCSESAMLYPEFAAELREETGIDIELDREGTLYLSLREADSAELLARYERQKGAGLNVEHLSAEETRKLEPFVSPDVRESLFFPGDWQVENRKLVNALRLYADINGIDIYENTAVTGLETAGVRIKGALTEAETFSADKVVLATGAWTSLIKLDGIRTVPVNVSPVKGQIVAYHTAKRLYRKVIYSPRGYLVPRADGRILAGATVENAGFDKETTIAGIDYLRDTATEISPSLGGLEIAESWAGLRPYASDGLPVIGPIAAVEDLFIATGHFRNGILLAPVTARILAESMLSGKASDYMKRFGPGRFEASPKSASAS